MTTQDTRYRFVVYFMLPQIFQPSLYFPFIRLFVFSARLQCECKLHSQTYSIYSYCIELWLMCVWCQRTPNVQTHNIFFPVCYCFWYVSIFYTFYLRFFFYSDVVCLWFAIWNNIEQLFSFFSSKMLCFACVLLSNVCFFCVFFSPSPVYFFALFYSFWCFVCWIASIFALSLHLLIVCLTQERKTTFYALLEAEFQLGEHNFWYCFNRFDVELKWFFFICLPFSFFHSLVHCRIDFARFFLFSLVWIQFFWHREQFNRNTEPFLFLPVSIFFSFLMCSFLFTGYS